jgi:hypothetical protein
MCIESYLTRETYKEEQPEQPRESGDVLTFKFKINQISDMFWRLKKSNDQHGVERLMSVIENISVASEHYRKEWLSSNNIKWINRHLSITKTEVITIDFDELYVQMKSIDFLECQPPFP